jgi:hypothetical protein
MVVTAESFVRLNMPSSEKSFAFNQAREWILKDESQYLFSHSFPLSSISFLFSLYHRTRSADTVFSENAKSLIRMYVLKF